MHIANPFVRLIINTAWVTIVAMVILLVLLGNERSEYKEYRKNMFSATNVTPEPGKNTDDDKANQSTPVPDENDKDSDEKTDANASGNKPAEPTNTPKPTDEPEPTDEPAATNKPTNIPEPTDTPEPTGEAVATPTPEPTEKPDDALDEEVPYAGMIALTFDDGPHGENTARILDILEKYEDAHVTFFVVGYHAEIFYEQMLRAHNMGCEIANHTATHARLTDCTPTEIQKEVEALNSILIGYGIPAAKLVRPPYGSVDEKVSTSVSYPLIMWSMDTLDYTTKDKDAVIEKVMSAGDGEVILLHDIHDTTVEAAEEFIPMLIKKGFKLVTVSELFEAKGRKLEKGQMYFCTRY